MDLGGDNNGNDRSGFNGCFYGSVYGSGNVVGSNSLTDIVTDTTNNGLSSSVKSKRPQGTVLCVITTESIFRII